MRSKYEPFEIGPNTWPNAMCCAGVIVCGLKKITSKSNSACRSSVFTASLSGFVRSTPSIQAAKFGMRGTGRMCL
ncbi:hypothetical protein D3C85_1638380 [compost metagenome]